MREDSAARAAGTGLIYAIDVPRFFDSDGDGTGDLQGVIAQLDYLSELGVSWIWLLPIYRSPREDNGYDVVDHCEIDPALGTLDDFRELLDGAHERGLRVIVELIAHHTSSQHPWFESSRSGRHSPYRDYYVWTDDPDAAEPEDSMFPGEEDSVWQHDDATGSWYRHKFYAFEPDLNLANPVVRDEVRAIARFWADLGVDGMRVDAATLVLRDKGLPGTEIDPADVFAAMHADNDPRPVLLAEVDRKPHDAAELIGEGKYDLMLNFSLNNALYLALAREDANPIAGSLQDSECSIGIDALANFARNVDELDLEQLTDEERAQVFDHFDPTGEFRIYDRGLTRGLPALMGSPERLELALSMLFAFPGMPVLMHGQEVGMRDDPEAPGRWVVRVPMPWEEAEAQQRDLRSRWHLVRELVGLRSRIGTRDVLVRAHANDPAVLEILSPGLRTLHNLAGRPSAEVDATGHAAIGRRIQDDGSLGAFGFGWFPLGERLPR